MKVYIQVGGETGHSEEKNLGSKGPPHYIQPRPLTGRALAGLECTLCFVDLICKYKNEVNVINMNYKSFGLTKNSNLPPLKTSSLPQT